jgi:hypothetical protein
LQIVKDLLFLARKQANSSEREMRTFPGGVDLVKRPEAGNSGRMYLFEATALFAAQSA